MRQITLILISVSFLIWGCKKEGNSNNTSGDYSEITLDGQTYSTKTHSASTSFPGLILNNQSGCLTNKIYSNIDMGRIMTTGWFCDIGLQYYQNHSDFKNSSSGTYSVKSMVGSKSCNLDLEVSIDNNPNNSGSGWILQSTNPVNTINSITEISQSSSAVKYRISGSFSCTFKTPSNKVVPVTGKYQTTIETVK